MTAGHLGEPIAGWEPSEAVQYIANLVWNPVSLQWEKATGGGVGANVNVTNFPATYPSTQSGVWSTGRTWTLSSGADSVAITGTATVSGTVAATQSGTWTVQQGTPPWTVSQSGTWNIGTVTTVTTVTAVTSITNSVAVTGPLTDTQLRATPVPISGTVTANTGLTQPLTDTQLRATPVPVSGTVTDGGSGKTLKTASFSLAATGTVVTAVGGKRIKVYAVKLVASAAISVNFRDGGATDLEGAMAVAANGGFVEGINPPSFLFGTTAGNSLDLVISGAGTAAGRVSYWDDDAS